MIARLIATGEWLWQQLEGAVERGEIWVFTRKWDELPAAIPAVLVAGTFAFILIGQTSKPQIAVVEPYRQAFRAAIEAQDSRAAGLWLQKLQSLGFSDNAARLQVVQLASERGEEQLAARHLAALAPDEGVGYAPAHRWVAEQLLANPDRWTDDERQRCQHHLQAARQAAVTPADQEAAAMLLRRATERALQRSAPRARESPEKQALLSKVWGTVAARSGDWDAARRWLEWALHQAPHDPVLLNNLAWVLAHSEPADLDRAVQLADAAVERLPENAEVRETRGQIQLRRGQWQAAIADLEFALARVDPAAAPALHAALAAAHRQLGHTAEAEQHEAASQQAAPLPDRAP